jgi:CBS domain-containing protein
MLQDVQFPLQLVISLLVMKLIMTAISFGSGFVGGVFAPALFLGASLGSVYGKILVIVLPGAQDYIASSPAYAMVGMAAVLAGSVRAPLTAVLLLFELTRDYRIVLPLMAAVGLSIWLVEYLHPQIIIDNTPDSEPLVAPAEPSLPVSLLVAEAMQPVPLQIPGVLPLLDAVQALLTHRCHSALVLDEDEQLIGILTLRDTYRWMAKTKSSADLSTLLQQPVQELCTTELICVYEDELVAEATDRMSTRGLQQIPVVKRDQTRSVVGLLTREGIDLAYGISQTREALQQQLEQFEAEF